MDGSAPGYYFRRSHNHSTDWLLFFEGGGWAFSPSDAIFRRSTPLGSSKAWPPSRVGTGILSADPAANPDLAHFNVAFFMYCDGFCFAGANATPLVHNGSGPIWFSGKANLDAIIDDLAASRGLAAAERVLLGGSSAGALSVYLHADYVGAKLRRLAPQLVDYRGVADAGFFPDIKNLANQPGLRPVTEWISRLANATSNARCIAAALSRPGEWPTSCFISNEVFRYIETPLFILNSLYDFHNLFDTLGLSCTPPHTQRWAGKAFCNATEMTYFQGLRSQVLGMWESLGILSSPQGGAFAPACICHTQTTEVGDSQGSWSSAAWTVPGGSGNTASSVFGRWWRKEGPPSSWKAVDVGAAWPNNRPCAGFGEPPECQNDYERHFNRGCQRGQGSGM